MPKVSIIIATRNRCALLPRAVESVRRAGSNIEIIVVDDSSQDQTRQVCESWDDVRYFRAHSKLGPGGARNLGLIASTSPYIGFLDDDDVRLPGSIDRQVELLEMQSDAGMIYGRALYGDDECWPQDSFYPEQCPTGDIFWQLLQWNFIPCPTVIFRRACLSRVGLLEDAAPGVEDWDLWVRIAELYPVLAIEQPVAIWRQATSLSGQFTSRSEKLLRETRRLHKNKWLRLPRVIEAGATRQREAARAFAESTSQRLVWETAAMIKAGDFPAIARVAVAGTSMYPIGVSKKILSTSKRLLARFVRNWIQQERKN